MQPVAAAQPVGLQYVIAPNAQRTCPITTAEIVGYDALLGGELERASLNFESVVNMVPLAAFRIAEACCKARAPALGQTVLDLLQHIVTHDPTLVSAEQRLRSVVDRLVVRAVAWTSAQLLAGHAQQWQALAERSRYVQNFGQDNLGFVDDVVDHTAAALQEDASYTLHALWLLACLGMLVTKRHQETLTTVVERFLAADSLQASPLQKQRLTPVWQKVRSHFSGTDAWASTAADGYREAGQSGLPDARPAASNVLAAPRLQNTTWNLFLP